MHLGQTPCLAGPFAIYGSRPSATKLDLADSIFSSMPGTAGAG